MEQRCAAQHVTRSLAHGGPVRSLAVLAGGRLASDGLHPRVSLGTDRGPVLRK
jgi:hypothetical protein